jgi:hypothetical protein
LLDLAFVMGGYGAHPYIMAKVIRKADVFLWGSGGLQVSPENCENQGEKAERVPDEGV